MIHLKNAAYLPAGFFISHMQRGAAVLFKGLLRMWGGYQADIALPHLSSHQRYVVASNHQTYVDVFAVYAPMTGHQRRKLAPMKFMMVPKLYHKWWLKPFVYILGAFPAHIKERKHHTYGVDGSLKLLNYGYNICIFPEGGFAKREESNPKPGVCRILQGHPEAQLILAHLEWPRNKHGRRYLKLVVRMAPPELDKNDPKAIMDAIYKL